MITAHTSDLSACISKVQRLSNCIEIANLINSELAIGKLLANVMETTKNAFTADAVSLLLLDEKTGDLTFQIALSEVGDDIKELYRLKKGQGIGGLVAQNGIPLNLEDAYDHPRFSQDYDKKTDYRTRAMLCVPLKIRGKIIGVIQVINKLKKPFVFTNEELEMLATIAGSAAVAIDTAKMHKIILKKETLERDLKLAREVQESFLPKTLPEIKNYTFSALMQPALEIGGDFYNFFKLPSNKLGIVLGDVSGKGISASLFMARLSSDLQYYTLIYPEPGQMLTQINTVLCQRAKRGMFVTLIYILLDPEENRFRIANAGHMSAIYSDSDGARSVNDNSIKGPPLGILPETVYEQKYFELEKNSSITLYTDGIIEAKNSSGELFGLKKLLKTIESQPNEPKKIVTQITSSVDQFTSTEGRSDDVTLLTFSCD
ncbi:MAG: SpoIIE family protein phosphatase [Desulfobacula sp.]|nr:SpoIIE family protein phosphatase [Desulfobacula sp.]